MFPEPQVVKGKRLVPTLIIGFIVFTIVGMAGTYYTSQAVSPFLRKNAEKKIHELEAKQQAEQASTLNTTTK